MGRATGGAQGRLQDGRRGEHLPREGRLIKISPEEPKAPLWWGSERVSRSIRAAIAKRHKWVAAINRPVFLTILGAGKMQCLAGARVLDTAEEKQREGRCRLWVAQVL